MKILGGQYRGRNFYMPAEIRPTQANLRAAIFDLLGHDIEGLTFIDIYAGSGAVGLEAISRGAEEVVFIEKEPKHAAVIRENCDLLNLDLGGQVKVIEGDALATIKLLSTQKRSFDIVFYDPPFDRRLGKKTLKVLGDNDILSALGFLIIQCDTSEKLEIPEKFKVIIERTYGNSALTVLQKKEN